MTVDEKLNLLLKSIDQFQRGMEVRFDRLEERMERIETRMERIETRMESIETRMDGQETRTEGIEQKLNAHIEKYNSDQTLIHASLFRLESSTKYILDKQQEHDMAIHHLQLQMDKQ